MNDFEKPNSPNNRRRRLGVLAATGLLATGLGAELSQPASASAQRETAAISAEKTKNPMISRIDGRMIHMVEQLKALKNAHEGAVKITDGTLNGERVTDYKVTMQVKNPQGHNSYTVIDLITKPDRDLPILSAYIPNSPTKTPDITGIIKPPNTQQIRRRDHPNVYILDSYNPDSSLAGELTITDSPLKDKAKASIVNTVYNDLTGLMEGFIQTKIASYKPSA